MKILNKIIILCLLVLVVQSCTVEKSAFKNKAEQTQKNDVTLAKAKSTFDFSTIDTENHEFTFTARDASEFMHIITPKGDTIQAKNTEITKKSTRTKTSNNITKNEVESEEDNSILESNETTKVSEKTETLSANFILYIVLGIVVLFGLIGSIALYLMYKTINKNANAVSVLLNKIT